MQAVSNAIPIYTFLHPEAFPAQCNLIQLFPKNINRGGVIVLRYPVIASTIIRLKRRVGKGGRRTSVLSADISCVMHSYMRHHKCLHQQVANPTRLVTIP